MTVGAMIVTVALAALPIPALAASSGAFDLVCVGQAAEADGAVSPFSTRLSIDRSGGRWCYRDVGCPLVLPIASAKAGKLTLLATQTPVSEVSFTVDLATGAFARSTRIPSRSQLATTESGVCKPAPFTAIP